MSTERVKARLQEGKPEAKQEEDSAKSVSKFLTVYKDRISRVIPQSLGITPERLGELAVTEMKRNPKLRQSDFTSLMGALVQAGKLGLEIGINAHLVPFWNKHNSCYEVQMIPDYRGLIALARRSGEIAQFSAHPVYKTDIFDYQYGSDEFLKHKPIATDEERGEDDIRFFYAIARFKGGTTQFDVMTKAEVDKIRARSRAKDDGPWVTDYVQMGCKTVSKRLCKYLPVSIELQEVVRMDDLHEAGKPQQNQAVIDTSYTVVPDEDEPIGKPKDQDGVLTDEDKRAALERERKEAGEK